MNQTTLYILIGAHGSGKSTYAEKLEQKNGAIHLNSEKLKEKIAIERTFPGEKQSESVTTRANKLMVSMAVKYLNNHCSIIIDTTNITAKTRKKLIDAIFAKIIDKNSISLQAICFNVPADICIVRNKQKISALEIEYAINLSAAKPHAVEDKVIIRMVNNLELPTKEEGFSDIVIYNENMQELSNDNSLDIEKLPNEEMIDIEYIDLIDIDECETLVF